MSEEELIESARGLVEIEKELSEREKEVLDEDIESENREEITRFWSPPIQGGQKERHGRTDYIVLKLSEELPDGTKKFHFKMPPKGELDNYSYDINRLLSIYPDVEHSNIGDLRGERLPLITKGKNDPDYDLSYDIHTPPVPTKPNKLVYRLRRLSRRLGLTVYRQTPHEQGRIHRTTRMKQNPDIPNISKTLLPLYESSIVPEDEQKFVPSNKGLALGVIAINVFLATSIFIAGSLHPALGFLSGLVSILVGLVVNCTALVMMGYWVSEKSNQLKKKYFPSLD